MCDYFVVANCFLQYNVNYYNKNYMKGVLAIYSSSSAFPSDISASVHTAEETPPFSLQTLPSRYAYA